MRNSTLRRARAESADLDSEYCKHKSVNKAACKVKSKCDNIAGVKLPVFEIATDGQTDGEAQLSGEPVILGSGDVVGLSKGGVRIGKCRTKFAEVGRRPCYANLTSLLQALRLIVELASLQV